MRSRKILDHGHQSDGCMRFLGDMTSAHCYERATNLDPENASIWNALGNSLFYLGQRRKLGAPLSEQLK
jgi:hypothetical protein